MNAKEPGMLLRWLHRLVAYDPMTGLANALYLKEAWLTRAFRMSRRNSRGLVFYCLDFDGFKGVNDGYGHDVGDVILRFLARRLSAIAAQYCIECRSLRYSRRRCQNHTVVRTGGDEFLVGLYGIDSPEGADVIGRQVLAELTREPCLVPLGGRKVPVSVQVSIGGVWFHPDSDQEDLKDPMIYVHRADGVLRKIKDAGRLGATERFRMLTPSLLEELKRDLERAARWRQALSGRFSCVMQAIVAEACDQRPAPGPEVMGAEVFIRPGGMGPEYDADFAREVRQMNRRGYMTELAPLIVEAACRQGEAWLAEGIDIPRQWHLNIPARLLLATDYCRLIAKTVQAHPCIARHLVLEITEDQPLPDTEDVRRNMRCLSDQGIRFALDGYGAGYSNLETLLRFAGEIEFVKIGAAYVRLAAQSNLAYEALKGQIAELKRLGKSIIIEGIETPAQRAVFYQLSGGGTDPGLLGQGFALSGLVPMEEFGRTLQIRHLF